MFEIAGIEEVNSIVCHIVSCGSVWPIMTLWSQSVQLLAVFIIIFKKLVGHNIRPTLVLIGHHLTLINNYCSPYAYSGHVINLPQDVARFANSLPHLPSELDIIVILGTFSFHFLTHFFLSMHTVIMVYQKLSAPLNCTLILDIHCWYPMYSLRLAPQWFTFTSNYYSWKLHQHILVP